MASCTVVTRKVHKKRYKCTISTHFPCTVPNILDQVQSPLTSSGPSFQTAHITYHVHTLVNSTLKMDKVCFSNMLVYHSTNTNRQKTRILTFCLIFAQPKRNVHTKYFESSMRYFCLKKHDHWVCSPNYHKTSKLDLDHATSVHFQ